MKKIILGLLGSILIFSSANAAINFSSRTGSNSGSGNKLCSNAGKYIKDASGYYYNLVVTEPLLGGIDEPTGKYIQSCITIPGLGLIGANVGNYLITEKGIYKNGMLIISFLILFFYLILAYILKKYFHIGAKNHYLTIIAIFPGVIILTVIIWLLENTSSSGGLFGIMYPFTISLILLSMYVSSIILTSIDSLKKNYYCTYCYIGFIALHITYFKILVYTSGPFSSGIISPGYQYIFIIFGIVSIVTLYKYGKYFKDIRKLYPEQKFKAWLLQIILYLSVFIGIIVFIIISNLLHAGFFAVQ